MGGENKDKLEKAHFCDCSVGFFLSSPVVKASLVGTPDTLV